MEKSIDKDQTLLKEYEDALRYETDPLKKAEYSDYIRRQRAAIEQYKQEYWQLQQQNWLQTLERHPLPEKQTRKALAAIEKQLPALAPQRADLAQTLNSPNLSADHKLKLSLPLIPFILNYEGEFGFSGDVNIRTILNQLIEDSDKIFPVPSVPLQASSLLLLLGIIVIWAFMGLISNPERVGEWPQVAFSLGAVGGLLSGLLGGIVWWRTEPSVKRSKVFWISIASSLAGAYLWRMIPTPLLGGVEGLIVGLMVGVISSGGLLLWLRQQG